MLILGRCIDVEKRGQIAEQLALKYQYTQAALGRWVLAQFGD